MTTPEQGAALTVAEACGQLGIGKTKFYELINSGELETFQHPSPQGRGGRRVDQAAIDAYKRKHRSAVAVAP